MKKLLSDQDNRKETAIIRQDSFFLHPLIPVLIGLLLFLACENDIEKINTLLSTQTLPELTGKNYEIIHSDSGKAKVRLLAPEIKKFSSGEKPYLEFPRGMTAYFYDDSLKIESVIEAKYVMYFEKERLWEAKNNVEARNLKNGNQLNTEHMFWNEMKRTIYSNTYTRIVNEDGTFYGEKTSTSR